MLLTNVINFFTDYFHFMPAVIVLCMQFPVVVASRAAFFDETVTAKVIILCLTNMLISGALMWGMHIAITNCGMIAVEAEILRSGNDMLLNNLEEGVIIQREDEAEILFQNSAAVKFQQ